MTQKEDECNCLFLPCFISVEDLSQDLRSAEIDRQLLEEKRNLRTIHRLLLLGTSESGKSTILKQMQLIHVSKFSEEVKQHRVKDIRNNLLDIIVSIVTALPTLTPPISLEDSNNTKSMDWILHNATKSDFDFPEVFYDHVAVLAKDKGIQAAIERSNEFQLSDSAEYFLDKVEEIRKNSYVPSEQDILRCRTPTKNIYELIFEVNQAKFQMIDVGGQRGERRKWFLCFNGVTAIIFVAACNAYDAVLREDPSKNRLMESLEVFKAVWNNKFLRTTAVIVFLNKEDLFKEKILKGRSKIEDHFPEYKTYRIPSNVNMKDEELSIIRAKCFISGLFERICGMADMSFSEEIYGYWKYHICYQHYTCAINTENIKTVFNYCRDSIQRRYLYEANLM